MLSQLVAKPNADEDQLAAMVVAAELDIGPDETIRQHGIADETHGRRPRNYLIAITDRTQRLEYRPAPDRVERNHLIDSQRVEPRL